MIINKIKCLIGIHKYELKTSYFPLGDGINPDEGWFRSNVCKYCKKSIMPMYPIGLNSELHPKNQSSCEQPTH